MVTQVNVVVITLVLFVWFGVGTWWAGTLKSQQEELEARKDELSRRLREAHEQVGTLRVSAEGGELTTEGR